MVVALDRKADWHYEMCKSNVLFEPEKRNVVLHIPRGFIVVRVDDDVLDGYVHGRIGAVHMIDFLDAIRLGVSVVFAEAH